MVKTLLYTYTGTNGTITSPIHLENIFSIKSQIAFRIAKISKSDFGLEFRWAQLSSCQAVFKNPISFVS